MGKNGSNEKVYGIGAWISPTLIEDTIRVWSKQSGRMIGKIEAVEILVNTRRLLAVVKNMTIGNNAPGLPL